PSGSRDSPPFARFRESSDVDLELSRLVRGICDPSAVWSEPASGFSKRGCEKRKRLLVPELRQNQQIAPRECRSPCDVQEEAAIRRPVRWKFPQTALQQRFFAARTARWLLIEIHTRFAPGEGQSSAVGRPDGFELVRRLEGEAA